MVIFVRSNKGNFCGGNEGFQEIGGGPYIKGKEFPP